MQQTEISKTGKRIPDNKVADIRVDMAYAYLDALKRNIPRGSNYTTKEVDFRTTAAFHEKVFNKHGYSIEHWTLHTPMRLIEKYHGSEKVENIWKTMMLTDGDYADALLVSRELKKSMDKLAIDYAIYEKYKILYLIKGESILNPQNVDDADINEAKEWSKKTGGYIGGEYIDGAEFYIKTLFVKDEPNICSPRNITWNEKPNTNWLIPWFNLFRDAIAKVYDPLTLDLDGDGIEALASNGHNGALFDHSNDGIRTATGWVGKDDGLLVYDRNGDGVINNGGELFGDNTLLKNGERAANGYQALKELETSADAITLIVEDNGPGIAADERARVLDPFYRQLGSEEEGTGLGLAIVKSLCDKHGATLNLHDAKNHAHGLRVEIRFPR